jgi:O-antigen/teichoic acid export membrane protein
MIACLLVTLAFAPSPTYVKFRRRSDPTLGILVASVALQLALLVALVPRFGASGAASAYGIATCGMYGAIAAGRELRSVRA